LVEAVEEAEGEAMEAEDMVEAEAMVSSSRAVMAPRKAAMAVSKVATVLDMAEDRDIRHKVLTRLKVNRITRGTRDIRDSKADISSSRKAGINDVQAFLGAFRPRTCCALGFDWFVRGVVKCFLGY